MTSNISTNFGGLNNLPSSAALHHATIPVRIAATALTTVAPTANDLIALGGLEAGMKITGLSFSADLPNTNPAGVWTLQAVNENDNDTLDIATIQDDSQTIVTIPGFFTNIAAATSGNFRFVFSPPDGEGVVYDGNPEAFTMYVTYTNAH